MIREALRYGGNGWAEYDRVFRQQTAIDPSLPWNNLNPSLVASTFLGSRTERMAFCQFCHEVDHNWEECALRSIRDPLPCPIPCLFQGLVIPSLREGIGGGKPFVLVLRHWTEFVCHGIRADVCTLARAPFGIDVQPVANPATWHVTVLIHRRTRSIANPASPTGAGEKVHSPTAKGKVEVLVHKSPGSPAH